MRPARQRGLFLARCQKFTHLKLDNTPNLDADFWSGALPGWLSLRRLFLYLQQWKESWELECRARKLRNERTFLSVSDPNSARLLSFQSYFFALTKPAMSAADSNSAWEASGQKQELLSDEQEGVRSTKECGRFYYSPTALSMRSRCGSEGTEWPWVLPFH